MSTDLAALEQRVRGRFPTLSGSVVRDELTFLCPADEIVQVLTFCRDNLACEYLADLSGIHWPQGGFEIERQPATTGWPTYRLEQDVGMIEVNYILRSISRNDWFRITVAVPDVEPSIPSVTGVYPTANYLEREVFDFFGVAFEGHPDLRRILMPDDWVGHPHRKDYPLGGIEIPYKNDKFIPPPDQRALREVAE